MTILTVSHFGTFANFKHYYLYYIKVHLHEEFPDAVSYNRLVELESKVFFKFMSFLRLYAFGRCTGISFVDSTMILVCYNLTRYSRDMPRMEKEPWNGVMVSNCISHVTTVEKSLHSVLQWRMWTTEILKYGMCLPKSCMADCLWIGDIYSQNSLPRFSMTRYILLRESKST